MSSGDAQNSAWTIQKLLQAMQTYLAGHHIMGARLDAEVLLCFVLGVDRVFLYTHFDQPITDAERQALRQLVRRRARREPIAYICGSKEFYSRSFFVDQSVLIPRPETEHIIEAALSWVGPHKEAPWRILDIGTGSGALAVTLACELPQSQVWGTDISADALAVAKRNAQAHSVADRLHLLAGDLFGALPADASFTSQDAWAPFDIIVSNPPYVAQKQAAGLAADVVRFEPHTALFGGPDGLNILKRLCQDVYAYAGAQSCVLVEMGFEQHAAVAQFLGAHLWHDVQVVHDLQGHPRVMVACKGARPERLASGDAAAKLLDESESESLPAPEQTIEAHALPSFDINTATSRQRTL